MLVDEDQELEHEDSGAWRLTIWGAHSGRPAEQARQRRGDWVRVSREIWGKAAPADHEADPERTQPLLPLDEVIPAPVEDIIPLPEELPAPSTEGLSWDEREPPYEPSRQDIWAGRRSEVPPIATSTRTTTPTVGGSVPTGRYVLPESWAASPRRKPLLRRWLGDT